jgi:hypothetical protein
MEMLSLPAEVIRRIAIGNGLNDLRTIFLIHDKRFLAVLSNRDFLARCLMPQEAGFLSQYIVPTYAWGERADLWEQARDCKHDWIVKPALLGKSEKVFAGSVTSDEAWRAVFETDLAKEMVLQPMIAQRQFSTLTETGPHFDYAVGTMLCFDNMFFGPGLLRTSSFPVTNQGDDRKMAALITDETDPLSTAPVL